MASAKGGIFQAVEEVESGGDTGVKEILVTAMTRGIQVHKGGHRGDGEMGSGGRRVRDCSDTGSREGSQESGKLELGSWRGHHLWSVVTGQMAVMTQTCQPQEKGDRALGF